MMILLRIQILHYDDDDDGRSSFHRSAKGTSNIKYGDDDDRSSFHRYVKETSVVEYDDDDRVSFTDL